ncbi:hypothetical protein BHM03_00017736 [Ensete ventricosum]|nr:hypothetical protein BHM03_00017736 [Ensete ventricosum]
MTILHEVSSSSEASFTFDELLNVFESGFGRCGWEPAWSASGAHRGYGSLLGWRSDDAVGPRWEFARRFSEGIGKLAGNTPGDCQKKTERLATRMLEATRLVGVVANSTIITTTADHPCSPHKKCIIF